MTTMSSARSRATPIESVSRFSRPDLTIRRSTSTSMVWLRRRSRAMSSSSGAQLAVDAGAHEALLAQRRQLLLELALAAADDRRQHVDALVGRIEHHQVEDALERLRGNRLAAVRAVRHADGGEQQAQVVVDLGDRADRRARVRWRWSSARWRWPATGRRSGRRPASPSARGTAGRRPTATRRSGAGPRRRWCRRRATTCPSPTGR